MALMGKVIVFPAFWNFGQFYEQEFMSHPHVGMGGGSGTYPWVIYVDIRTCMAVQFSKDEMTFKRQNPV